MRLESPPIRVWEYHVIHLYNIGSSRIMGHSAQMRLVAVASVYSCVMF